MFTGIVEETGVVKEAKLMGGTRHFAIGAKAVTRDLAVDHSIAINGVCLTVTELSDATFHVEAVEETLRKTALGSTQKGRRVNLERSLRFSDRLGGHLVQGHVDGVGRVTAIEPQQGGRLLSILVPEGLMKYVISEGSIAIDGVSLTVARVTEKAVTISLIPHTLEKTTLANLNVGDHVNIEVDIIGKYVEKLLSRSEHPKMSETWLHKLGYETG